MAYITLLYSILPSIQHKLARPPPLGFPAHPLKKVTDLLFTPIYEKKPGGPSGHFSFSLDSVEVWGILLLLLARGVDWCESIVGDNRGSGVIPQRPSSESGRYDPTRFGKSTPALCRYEDVTLESPGHRAKSRLCVR